VKITLDLDRTSVMGAMEEDKRPRQSGSRAIQQIQRCCTDLSSPSRCRWGRGHDFHGIPADQKVWF